MTEGPDINSLDEYFDWLVDQSGYSDDHTDACEAEMRKILEAERARREAGSE